MLFSRVRCTVSIMRLCTGRFVQSRGCRRALGLVGCIVVAAGIYTQSCIVNARKHHVVLDLNYCTPQRKDTSPIPSTAEISTPRSPVALRELKCWDRVAPTLMPGDIVLLMGTGRVSRMITLGAYLFSFMNPIALKYSHIGVIVSGPQKASVPQSPKFPEESKPVVMEAVDNRDVKCQDINGAQQYNQVQLVPLKSRVFGRDGERKCYNRCAVRRLKGFEWTPARLQKLEEFIRQYEGRPLVTSKTVLFAFAHPSLFFRHPANAVSCSELVVEMYKAVGIFHADADRYFAPIATAPVYFADDAVKLPFAEGVSLQEEEWIVMD